VQRISTKPPTAIAAAYDAYLRGLGIEHSQAGFTALANAANGYEEAVRLDPDFALAWARLSLVRSNLYYNGQDRNTNSPDKVKESADRAIALAPELGEAWLAQGTYKYRVLRDLPGGLEAYHQAEKRLPNSALVNQYIALASARLGRWRDALVHINRATELDPRNARLCTVAVQNIYVNLGRWRDAEAALNRALEISPDDHSLISLKVDLFQWEGRLDQAAKELSRLPEDPSNQDVVIARVQHALLEHDLNGAISRAKQVTDLLVPEKPLTPQDILILILQGYAQRWSGQDVEAHAAFARVISELEPASRRSKFPNIGGRSFLALAYAGIGDKENALEQARLGVEDEANDAIIKPNAEANRATVLAQLGEVDAAMAELPHLVEVPAGIHPGDLRYSPFWDPLRKDPRFEALVKDPPPIRY
jgi:tetratricopeptide (TPR) repeat protein